jgi:hypothetical protein
VQLNAGRFEISVSYQIAIAVGLLSILLLLVAFRLGQMDQRARYGTVRSSARPEARSTLPAAQTPPASTTPSAPSTENTAGAARAATTTSQGDHWIVLASYPQYADLEAVRAYFAENGISTEIFEVDAVRKAFLSHGLNASVLPSGGGYLLVTSRDKYFENPEKPGTDGYAMKEKIKELGAKYKPDNGFESFAPKRFSDAYGMKIR